MNLAQNPRRLLFHGILLFLLGLLTGLVVHNLTNPRMGLSAHLEGVMNGVLLVVLGLVWPHLRLGARAEGIAFWSVLYAAYANWATTLLSAYWGTGKLTTVAGAGHVGADWQEAIVSAGLVTVTLAGIGSICLVLFGLRGAKA